MSEAATMQIVLTKEQQLEVLAATGLIVTTLAVPVTAAGESGEVMARLPLPGWRSQRVTDDAR